MHTNNYFNQILLALGLLALALPGFAATGAKVATVIVVTGEVSAVQPDKTIRKLQRARRVFAGEVVRTGPNSTAKLKFVDGAIMNLRADTEYRVDEYSFDATVKENNKHIATLLKGGMRVITGAIGKVNPDGYLLHTHVATVGIRGTDLEAVIGSLDLAVRSGNAFAFNRAGRINLGPSQNFQFAQIPNRNTPPIGQLQAPRSLNTPQPTLKKDEDVSPQEEAMKADIDAKLTLEQILQNAVDNQNMSPEDAAKLLYKLLPDRAGDIATAAFSLFPASEFAISQALIDAGVDPVIVATASAAARVTSRRGVGTGRRGPTTPSSGSGGVNQASPD